MRLAAMIFAFLSHAINVENVNASVLYLTEDRLPVNGEFRSVYEIDTEELEASVIYTSDLGVRDVVCAAQSERLIVHATDYESGRREVHIIDRNGGLVRKFEKGVWAVFVDEAGNRMVYTKGELNKNLLIESRGTWIYDFRMDQEMKIADSGLKVEWAAYNQSVYVSGGGGMDFRYSIETGQKEPVQIETEGFSPEGTYRWTYGTTPTTIERCATGEVISTGFALIKSGRHGTPLYWMNDHVLMLPHYRKELEDYLLFVETGKTLKAPGRILSITEDEKFVYIAKPGLVIEKLSMAELEVLYPGKDVDREGDLSAAPNSVTPRN